ncbi:MAG: acyl-CoA dehydrogenase family protein [Thermodesulfobacteriota bacterium]
MPHQDSLEDRSRDILSVTAKISHERIAPAAAKRDLNGTYPWEELHLLGQAGLLAPNVSQDHGGAGLSREGFSSVVKELARRCASTALVSVSHSIVAKALESAGTEAATERLLPKLVDGRLIAAFAVHEAGSGSNAGAISSRAERVSDRYVANGSKIFVTSGGEADVYLVLLRTQSSGQPQGMSMLVVEKDTPGLSFGRCEDRMGMRGTSSREMFLTDCEIPVENLVGEEGQGTRVIGQSVVGWGFFGAAAIGVGLAQSALDIAVKHAKERTIAGQAIGTYQAIQFMITDMAVGTEAADALLMSCAAQADRSPDTAVMNAFRAKLFASETAVKVTDTALQVLGGHGYCREYGVERLYRDARGLTLHFKTSEWLRQDIAKAVLGL